jgi:hypothetical protein
VRSAQGLAGTVMLVALVTLVALLAGLTITGCGAGTTPTTAGAEASATALASPVAGVLVKIDSQGLTKVRGFTLRTESGEELPFTLGTLENGAEFPPGHLAEHMSTSSPVRVFFRDEGGKLVVYRIEDGE